MRELVRNPFNLELLAGITSDLKEKGESVDQLIGIRSQVELLHEYWHRRVHKGWNADAREVFVLAAARQVLQSGQLRVAHRSLTVVGSEANDLLRDGVFVAADRSKDYLRFFHNAFLDFACARVLRTQMQTPDELIGLLRDTRKTLRLLPSIRVLLAYLQCFSAGEFWLLFRAMSSRRLSAIWNVLPAHVLADGRVSRQELEPLIRWLDEDASEWADEATKFLFQALHERKAVDPAKDDGWLDLCIDLTVRLRPTFVSMYLAYLDLWSEQAAHLSMDQGRRLNKCARAVFQAAKEQAWGFGRLTARSVSVIARTTGFAPHESRETLTTVAQAHDCHECQNLAREIAAIAAANGSLAADLMIALFSHRETSDQKVIISESWVLGMYQSGRDAWYWGVWYALQEAYPKLLELSPVEATRALLAVIQQRMVAEREEFSARRKDAWEAARSEEPDLAEWSDETQDDVTAVFAGGRSFRYEPDGSYMWYDGHEGSPALDAREKLLSHLENWLASAGDDGETQHLLVSVFDLLYQRNSLAAIWNRCLRAAARAPKALALHVFPLLSAPEVLRAYDSRTHVVAALGSTFALYGPHQREAIERAILAMPESAADEQENGWLERARDRLITGLPAESIILSETRQLAAKLAISTETPEDEATARFSGIGSREPSIDAVRRLDGVDTTSAAYQRLKPLVEPVSAFIHQTPADSSPSVEACAAVHAELVALENGLNEETQPGVERGQLEWAMIPLADAAANAVKQHGLAADHPVFAWAVGYLLSACSDPSPQLDPDREAEFESRSAAWPGSGIRGTAVGGLMRVARRRDLTREQCEKIDEAIRRLVCDPAKAVRWHIVAHIDWLCETKPDLMWELAEHSVAEDTSPRVLSFMFHACRRLVHRAPPMVTRLACRALDRFPESGPEGGLNQQAYDVLAEAAIFHSEPAARARLDMLLEEPITDASPLSSIVHDFRDLLMYESDVEPDRAASIRMNAISFYERAGRRAAQQLADIMREYGLVGPMPNDAVERGRSAAQVLDALALSLYFALETDRQGRNGVPGPTEEQRRRLFVEARGIIQVLAEVRHPTVHHNFVKMLGCAVHLEPRAVVELVARSLRTEDAFDARHYEQLTLDELVKIGETLLADHRDLLEDVEISASFIAALDGFVRAGWPEAHRLVRLFEDAAR